MTLQKFSELKYDILPYLAHSPALDLTDFNFFKHLDHFLKEKFFSNAEGIKNAFKAFIASKICEFYKDGVYKLVSRLQQCVDADN